MAEWNASEFIGGKAITAATNSAGGQDECISMEWTTSSGATNTARSEGTKRFATPQCRDGAGHRSQKCNPHRQTGAQASFSSSRSRATNDGSHRPWVNALGGHRARHQRRRALHARAHLGGEQGDLRREARRRAGPQGRLSDDLHLHVDRKPTWPFDRRARIKVTCQPAPAPRSPPSLTPPPPFAAPGPPRARSFRELQRSSSCLPGQTTTSPSPIRC